MEVLREYHAAMGELILSHPGTLERFAGDGMMIFFNDPVPVPNPAERALQLAPAMRERAGDLHERWRRLGYDLGVAIGMATVTRPSAPSASMGDGTTARSARSPTWRRASVSRRGLGRS